ncbi:hypothetical protein M422DRAFT_252439 [Sphaerobolus stellatus SS14]|uniref:CCHC-type domain-containing protein n=1 Tax=Sphaerobolus stellatus (strain SS14) TaxID=990650 RepID=A0A0C9VPD7_SPHS4|nr:hypothetical protein M422DRAFT_252439 [Sphaerobolus stellatus SS14]
MSATKHSTLSSMHAIFKGLQDHIVKELSKLPNTASDNVCEVLLASHRKLSDYFFKIDESPYPVWASLLDLHINYKGLVADHEDKPDLLQHIEKSKNRTPEAITNIRTFGLTDESTDTSVVTAPESPSQQPVGILLGNLPTMTTEVDHLNTLELSLTEEQAKTDRIENQLNRLLALLDPTGENAELAPPGEAPSVQAMDEDTPSEMNTGRGFQMSSSNPSDFDGDRAKGQSFLNSCNLYFSIAGRAFHNEQARISWALTFFKSGQAASFADWILRTQASTRAPYFTDWKAFETEFKKELVFHSGYVDEANLVVKFKKELNKSLRTTVATADPVPAFDDLEAWIEAAQRIADARETSKVFEENIRTVERQTPSGTKPLSVVPRMLPVTPPTRTFNYQARLPINPPVVNSRPETNKAPDGPIPMDVDRTRGKASISNIVCRHCGKTGHIARFCDTTFDVWSLTVEEKEELLYGLMADLDMSDTPAPEPAGEEEVISEREDFAKRDE